MHRHERQERRPGLLIYGLMTLALLVMPGATRSAFAQGEWATNGTNIHNTNDTGNVGVGTTTPGQLFTIFGKKSAIYSESAAPTANASIFNVNNSAVNNEYSSLQFQVSADNFTHNGLGFITLVKPLNSNSGSDFAFTLRKGAGTYAEAMRISSAGNVGIGTTSPLSPLHIGPNSDFAAVSIHAGGRIEPNLVGGLGSVYDRGLIVAPVQTAAAAGNSALIYARPNIATGITQATQYGLFVDNPKAGVGTITNYYPGIFMGGNVGVGTTTPAARLDVNGTVNAAAFTVDGSPFTSSQWTTSGANINYASGNVGIGTATPGTKLDVNGTVNADAFTLNGLPFTGSQWTTSGTHISYGTGNVGIGAAAMAIYKLHVNGTVNATAFTLNGAPFSASQWTTSGTSINYDGGKVGIGTTNPTAQLHVLGTSNVTTFAGLPYNMAFHSDNPFDPVTGNAGVGPGFLFGGYYGAAQPTTFAGIHGVKENEASGNYSAALLFSTRVSGQLLKERMRITSTGNVGIGTNAPAAKLDVNGTVNADAFTVNGASFTSSQWATSGTTINYAAGNVGIGTTTPAAKLDVSGTVNAAAFTVDGSPFASSQWATNGANISYSTGNVGIGAAATATSKLHVNGTVNATGFTLNGAPFSTSQWTTSGTTINYAAGNVGIGTASPTKKLQVVGDVEATNINATGDITATGKIAAKYQDVAEWVPAREKLAAGTVVVLDVETSNQVTASTRAYDTKVAGVVSAQPGVILGLAGEDKAMVATTGRVKVKVDATRGPIKVGDLLVTSDVEGVAMKSEPLDLGGTPIHRPGTLIGKALEPLAAGTGEILVLLSLQ